MDDQPLEATAGPPPRVDVQDPLPESKWFWRRLFVFSVTLVLLALLWDKVDAVSDVARAGSETAIDGLVAILKSCIVLIGMLILFYLLAPSAEQLTKLIQTARVLKLGGSITNEAKAKSADGAEVTTTTTAIGGKPEEKSEELPEYAR